jgi:carbon monoxide dehydrogenase subunit G
MIKIEASTTINKPVETVFEFVNSHQNAYQWLSGLVETRPDTGTEGVGHTWTDVIQMYGRKLETDFIVTEFEPNQKVAFESMGGSISQAASYSFNSDGDGTRVTFSGEGEPGGFFKLAEPILARMLQRQWEANLANLNDVLEATGDE